MEAHEPDEDTCRRAAMLHADKLAGLLAVWEAFPSWMQKYIGKPDENTMPTMRAISLELHADMIAARIKGPKPPNSAPPEHLLAKARQGDRQRQVHEEQGQQRRLEEDVRAGEEKLQGQRLAEISGAVRCAQGAGEIYQMYKKAQDLSLGTPPRES